MPDMPNTFSPSELVYLNGDRFAPTGSNLMGHEPILGTDKDVAPRDLAIAALTAAVLALEQAGTVHLAEEQKKQLFGLTHTKVLRIEAGESQVRWPRGSLESSLARIAPSVKTVHDLVYALFSQHESDPHRWINTAIRGGLIQRGLVNDEVTKRLYIFTSHSYSLPDSTTQALAAKPITTIRQLRTSTISDREQVWRLLQHEISSALDARFASSNTYPNVIGEIVPG